MTVRHGREFLCIPGPTPIPDAVLSAMHRPAVEIYTGEIVAVTETCLRDLKGIFRTDGDVYIYVANGHGTWEAAVTNVLSRGDTILVLASGRFAVGWGDATGALGVDVETVPCDWRHAVDPAAVEARLREDKEGKIKAVLVAQIDTATGVVNDIPAIRAAMDRAGHGALLMVDTVASLATSAFDMDGWGVDVAMSASQKGLMTPPGLGFVAVGPRAKAVHRNAGLRTRYWDWTLRDGEAHYQKYCGTPPEHLLFGLRKALDLLLDEGLDNALRRHALLAEAVRRAVATWSEGGAMEFNIVEPAQRANAVTTILLREGIEPERIRQYCIRNCGVILGGGIGDLTGKALRIAHMGHVNAPMILGTLSTVEVALQALGLPHGRGGVQAAIDWLGQSVPEA